MLSVAEEGQWRLKSRIHNHYTVMNGDAHEEPETRTSVTRPRIFHPLTDPSTSPVNSFDGGRQQAVPGIALPQTPLALML